MVKAQPSMSHADIEEAEEATKVAAQTQVGFTPKHRKVTYFLPSPTETDPLKEIMFLPLVEELGGESGLAIDTMINNWKGLVANVDAIKASLKETK